MSSDGTARCVGCGRTFVVQALGRPRRYCCNACRQVSYRRRVGHATVAGPHHSEGCEPVRRQKAG